MRMLWYWALVAMVPLTGCETPTSPRYSISADTNLALKALGVSGGIAVGTFESRVDFSSLCRGLGPIRAPDGMTHVEYVRRAFEDELKVAGLYGLTQQRVVLKGAVRRMEFSSMRALTGGAWDIDVLLSSTAGTFMEVSEHYEFDSGFVASDACRQTADAFPRAVQNLVRKAVTDPRFKALVQ